MYARDGQIRERNTYGKDFSEDTRMSGLHPVDSGRQNALTDRHERRGDPHDQERAQREEPGASRANETSREQSQEQESITRWPLSPLRPGAAG